jgi:uncharacterized protein (DUF427 family)
MSTLVRTSLMSGLAALRHEPTAKRIRAMVGDTTVVDSTRAILLWEPRRVVPSWAVPVGDVRAELRPAAGSDAPADPDAVGHRMPEVSARPVLDPSIPFAFHTASGRPVDVIAEAALLPGAGFLLDDADLSGYLVLDFAAFDRWWEEDEENVGHPRDPFHRIDILQSSRNVRIEHRGVLLAEPGAEHVCLQGTRALFLLRGGRGSARGHCLELRIAVAGSPTDPWTDRVLRRTA